jgi:TolB-like protein/Tfp pilus assembly protein PilF
VRLQETGTMGAERVRRRLAAILAADVVGYSRLVEADEEGTHADLKILQTEVIGPRVAADSGRIVKTTGDGILIEFSSAVDAVRSALALQSAVAKRNAGVANDRHITFRIGINVGDVIVEGDDIHGDGVNVAARLEGLCEPGEVYVAGTVHDQVAGKLPVGFDDLGMRTVKNIARPIRVYRARPIDEASGSSPARSGASLPLAEKPSIAVLPFDNMSGDPAQDYFSDGITEDIITELARFRSLFVAARHSSFLVRGKTVDVTEIGRRLGVRYVAQGSVRKTGNRVRVTVQLLDAASGNHLWAERYDRELEDIFLVQDEITQAVVAALPARLEDAGRDLARRKQTSNITAYDLVLLGNERWRRLTGKDLAAARDCFQRAVGLDPQYARAHANIAWTHVCDVFLEPSAASCLDEALRHMEVALDIDDSDAWSHGVFAQLLFLLRKDVEADIHFNRALALNPNDADVAAVFANILVYWGRWREALTRIGTAKRLNPFPPDIYHWYHALALYSGREYEPAVKALKAMRSHDRWSHGLLAACYAQMGRLEEARAEAEAFVRERQRELQERREAPPPNPLDLALARADRYRDSADREHFLDGLRKAGLTD